VTTSPSYGWSSSLKRRSTQPSAGEGSKSAGIGGAEGFLRARTPMSNSGIPNWVCLGLLFRGRIWRFFRNPLYGRELDHILGLCKLGLFCTIIRISHPVLRMSHIALGWRGGRFGWSTRALPSLTGISETWGGS
jgi:hypothetical protein